MLGYVDPFTSPADLVHVLTATRRHARSYTWATHAFDQACTGAAEHLDGISAAVVGQARGLPVFKRSLDNEQSDVRSAKGLAQPLIKAHVTVDIHTEIAVAEQALNNLAAVASAAAAGYRAALKAAGPIIAWPDQVARRLDALIAQAASIDTADVSAAIDTLAQIATALATLNKVVHDRLGALHYTRNNNRDGGMFLQGCVDLATDVMLVEEATRDYADELRELLAD